MYSANTGSPPEFLGLHCHLLVSEARPPRPCSGEGGMAKQSGLDWDLVTEKTKGAEPGGKWAGDADRGGSAGP